MIEVLGSTGLIFLDIHALNVMLLLFSMHVTLYCIDRKLVVIRMTNYPVLKNNQRPIHTCALRFLQE